MKLGDSADQVFYEWYEREYDITLTDEERAILKDSILKARYDKTVTLQATIYELEQTLKETWVFRLFYALVRVVSKVI